MIDSIILYLMSGLCIVLGFVALLLQKTYVDTNTNTPTEVELPLIGKLKTNIPALVFLLVGAGLAFYAFHAREQKGHEDWSISGKFVAPAGRQIEWEAGTIYLWPKPYEDGVGADGTFAFDVAVPPGKHSRMCTSRFVTRTPPRLSRMSKSRRTT